MDLKRQCGYRRQVNKPPDFISQITSVRCDRTAPENEAKIIKGNKSSHNSHPTPPETEKERMVSEGKSVRKM